MKTLSVFLTFGLLLGTHLLAAQMRRVGSLPALQPVKHLVQTNAPIHHVP